MHTARVVARAAAVAARTGARAQSTAVAPAAVPAGGASFLDNLLFDAPVQNSLDETFAGVPDITGVLAEPTKVQVSKLPNGLTVVSQDSHRGASTIGVYFKGGSRTETVPGTAFAAQQLAFQSTQKRSALKLFRDVDVFGGSLAATASAETLAYTASGTRDAVPALAEAVAETLTAPALEPWELEENAAWASAAAAAARAAPGAAILADVHAAAFGEGSALGAAPVASGPAGVEDVKAFLSAHVQGKNAVLTGVNVDHAALVEAGDLLLLGLPEGAPTKFAPVTPRGGEFITRTGAGVTSLGLGFALTGSDPKQAAALAVLQAALGGPVGHSKYVSVRKNQIATLLAKEGALPAGSTLAANLASYSDASLFTLYGAATGAGTGAWVDGAVGLLKEVAGGKLTEAEVANAAKVATLAAVGPLDGIAGLRNDMGAQLALTGAYVDAAGKAAALAAVKPADVAAAAKAVLAGTPGVAAIGDASGLPRFDKFLTSLL